MSFIALVIFSCGGVRLADCDCDKMKIYGDPLCDLLVPVASSKEDVKKGKFVQITDFGLKNRIITSVLSLEKINDFDPGRYGIDNKFLIEIQCQDSSIVEIEAN